MSKTIVYSDEARNKLAIGVKKLTDAVKVTLGSRGRNVLIANAYGGVTITKDGISVANSVVLEDKLENLGATLIKQVAKKTVDETSDGTTTATVLANAIFSEGLRNVTSGANPIELQRGMNKALEAILEKLKESSKSIQDKKEITQIATISANSDSQIGNMIADALDKVGNDGIITIEEGKGISDELLVVEGMQFARGYLSPYFITNSEKMTAELENPFILLTDQKIMSLNDLLPVLEQVQKTSRPLLIIADDFDTEALNTLVVNNIRGVLNVTAIKAPGFGLTSKGMLQDIAILINGVVISEDIGESFNTLNIEKLGQSEKVIISKDNTVIVNGLGTPDEVQARVQELKSQLDAIKDDFLKDKHQERIAKLSGGIAVIKVGASTETEMKERKDRFDDALGATKAAVAEGIVIGGGCALVRASKKVKLDLEGDQKIGADIILKAVRAPLKQIATNAGFDSGVVVNAIEVSDNDNIGFNASTGEYVDMFLCGIIDPFKVERVALTNATSIASLLLTTEVAIFEDDSKDSK